MKNNIREDIDKIKNINGKKYIYHGTGKGQALNIQKIGFMKLNNTGDESPSISFTNSLDYANYYATAKGGTYNKVILRTPLDNNFKISDKIFNNNGDEYVTFNQVPSSNLEINTGYGWKPLDKWNIIFNEPL